MSSALASDARSSSERPSNMGIERSSGVASIGRSRRNPLKCAACGVIDVQYPARENSTTRSITMPKFLPATLAALLTLLVACSSNPAASAHAPAAHAAHRVSVFVWDGMRPDSISEADTPHLAALARRGTYFADNHSSYPTFTMMNAAAFATGTFSGKSGFYGTTVYRPGAPARTSVGDEIDLNDPVFTEDYGILKQLDANQDEHLFLIGTLFQAAQKA